MQQSNKLAQQIPILTLHNNQKIPQIGFGTYCLRGDECYKSVLYALKSGYRSIDTATFYSNETYIAKALKQFFEETPSVKREDLFITSKVGPWDSGYDRVQRVVKQIIQELGLTYLDLILIHWPGTGDCYQNSQNVKKVRQETWLGLLQLKKQGLVKNVGVSNFEQRHIESLFEVSDELPVINQFEIHPLCTNKETIKYCQEKNIQVEAYSSLARQDDKLFKSKIMIDLAEKYGKSIAQISLRWSFQQGNILLPKSKTEKYIIQNMDIFDFEISQEDMKLIDSLHIDFHTCWDPKKIAI